MQSVSSRIRTRVFVSISYDDIRYTMGTSSWCIMKQRNQIKPNYYLIPLAIATSMALTFIIKRFQTIVFIFIVISTLWK